jgi:two-component system sensor histidine kinase RegB
LPSADGFATLPAMPRELEPDASVRWLIRLRWVLLAGQAAALVIAPALGATGTWLAFGLAVVAGVASNLWLAAPGPEPSRRLGPVLAIDVVLLTVLLASSGGPLNPFTILYLVFIVLSVVVLSARWTTAITTLALAGYAALFAMPAPPAPTTGHHHGHDAGMGAHLSGMWVAFALGALLTAFFVRRMVDALARQRAQIAELRETAARNARLASLTALAAGAAHELGSPLTTIAVAAHDAHLAARRTAPALADDLALILDEVGRCQAVLDRMSARASQAGEDDVVVDGPALTARLTEQLGPSRAAAVAFATDDPAFAVRSPIDHLAQSVAALIHNALDASPAGAPVEVHLRTRATRAEVEVVDRGPGLEPDVVARVGEPFFTTKQPGRGMGLGVFLARAFFESHGGSLIVTSTPGSGTRALATLPVAEVAA